MDKILRKQYIVTKHKKDIFEIAEEIYGNAGMAAKILRANPGVYALKAGMVLNLPDNEPQKPATTDQALRLDFAGLKDYHPTEAAPDLEFDSKVGSLFQKEQLARELLDLFMESGLPNPALEPEPEVVKPVGSPEKSKEGASVEMPSATVEKQLGPEEQGDASIGNQQENVEGLTDSEQENQSELNGTGGK